MSVQRRFEIRQAPPYTQKDGPYDGRVFRRSRLGRLIWGDANCVAHVRLMAGPQLDVAEWRRLQDALSALPAVDFAGSTGLTTISSFHVHSKTGIRTQRQYNAFYQQVGDMLIKLMGAVVEVRASD